MGFIAYKLYKPPPIFGSSPRRLITLTHQQKYFEIVEGEDERYEDWLDYVVCGPRAIGETSQAPISGGEGEPWTSAYRKRLVEAHR